MSSEKLTRKEIREPDPFVRVSTAYWAKLMEQRKLLTIVLGVLVVAFLGLAIASKVGERKDAKAGDALSRALEQARRPVAGSLEPTLDSELPQFASYKEKNEQLSALYEGVRKDFPASTAAVTATLFLADAEFQLGKMDEAAGHYREFLDKSSSGNPLRALAQEGLGYVAESKKSWDEALKHFEQMSREAAGDALLGRAAFHRARVLEQQGKKQEAAEAFQKLKDEFKDAPAAQEASERLALLAAQGVVPPVSAKPDAKDTAANAGK